MSGPEMVRGAVGFATEVWLTGKCLGAAEKFYSLTENKVTQFLKKVEQGLATTPELLASAEGLEVLMASEAAETVKQAVKQGFDEVCRAKLLKASEDMANYVEQFRKLGLNAISKKDLKHIFKNHVPGGQGAVIGSSSVFSENIDVIQLALEAWTNGTEVVSGAKIFDTGKIVGFAIDGSSTTKVRVCLNGTRDAIRTVFPVN